MIVFSYIRSQKTKCTSADALRHAKALFAARRRSERATTRLDLTDVRSNSRPLGPRKLFDCQGSSVACATTACIGRATREGWNRS